MKPKKLFAFHLIAAICSLGTRQEASAGEGPVGALVQVVNAGTAALELCSGKVCNPIPSGASYDIALRAGESFWNDLDWTIRACGTSFSPPQMIEPPVIKEGLAGKIIYSVTISEDTYNRACAPEKAGKKLVNDKDLSHSAWLACREKAAESKEAKDAEYYGGKTGYEEFFVDKCGSDPVVIHQDGKIELSTEDCMELYQWVNEGACDPLDTGYRSIVVRSLDRRIFEIEEFKKKCRAHLSDEREIEYSAFRKQFCEGRIDKLNRLRHH